MNRPFFPARLLAHPASEDRCALCQQMRPILDFKLILDDTTGAILFQGCAACLRARLAGPVALPFAAQVALEQARRVITQPVDRHDIDRAVALIDGLLGQHP